MSATWLPADWIVVVIVGTAAMIPATPDAFETVSWIFVMSSSIWVVSSLTESWACCPASVSGRPRSFEARR